jgi:uncharacterized protein (TIGR03000 family)
MNRTSWKCLLVGAVVAVALLSAAPQADARWWGGCCGGYWGCGYAPCYSGCYSYGCGYGCGYDCGGWALGWRHGPIRRALFGRYKWYPTGYGCGYGGCYSGCYAGCGAYPAYDSCCGDGAVIAPTAAPAMTPTPAKRPAIEPTMPMEPAPGGAAPAAPSPQPEPAMPKTSASPAEESGSLTIWVPFDAKVTVNGLETRSTGSRRQFVSYGLKPGFSYKYEVRAQVVRDGKTQEENRTVVLTAGQITAVAFGFNTNAAAQVASTH